MGLQDLLILMSPNLVTDIEFNIELFTVLPVFFCGVLFLSTIDLDECCAVCLQLAQDFVSNGRVWRHDTQHSLSVHSPSIRLLNFRSAPSNFSASTFLSSPFDITM